MIIAIPLLKELFVLGCYGTITASPSPSKTANGCCSNDANCENDLVTSGDIEDIASNTK